MWLSERLFKHLTSRHEAHVSDLKSGLNVLIEKTLAAKQSEVEYLLKVKDEEIGFLKQHISTLESSITHERTRAEAAVDRLLAVKEVQPVGNADIIRTQAEKDTLAAENYRHKEAKLREVFSSVQATGEDLPDMPSATERLASIGGFQLES